jgi:hypothetical protein
MSRKKQTHAAAARSAKIIRLPHADFGFEAYDFEDGELSDRYDRDRTLVVILEAILRMDAATLKQKAESTAMIGDRSIADWCGPLIHDLKAVGEGLEGLSMLFACAAARLEVIKARLV